MSFTDSLLITIKEFVTISLELAVLFVLVSILVGILSVYISKERIQRVLGTKRSFLGSILGAVFGALTPFCSCSTIPITLGLLNSGVSFSSAMSFLFPPPLCLRSICRQAALPTTETVALLVRHLTWSVDTACPTLLLHTQSG